MANLRRIDLVGTRAALVPHREAWALPTTYGLLALFGIVALQKGSPASLDGRMISPLIPFALLALLEGASRVRWAGLPKGRRLGLLWVTAGAALFLVGQAAYFLGASRTLRRADADARAIQAALAETMEGEEVGDFFAPMLRRPARLHERLPAPRAEFWGGRRWA